MGKKVEVPNVSLAPTCRACRKTGVVDELALVDPDGLEFQPAIWRTGAPMRLRRGETPKPFRSSDRPIISTTKRLSDLPAGCSSERPVGRTKNEVNGAPRLSEAEKLPASGASRVTETA